MHLHVLLYFTLYVIYCVHGLVIHSFCGWLLCVHIQFGFCLGHACEEAEYATVVVVVDLVNQILLSFRWYVKLSAFEFAAEGLIFECWLHELFLRVSCYF